GFRGLLVSSRSPCRTTSIAVTAPRERHRFHPGDERASIRSSAVPGERKRLLRSPKQLPECRAIAPAGHSDFALDCLHGSGAESLTRCVRNRFARPFHRSLSGRGFAVLDRSV